MAVEVYILKVIIKGIFLFEEPLSYYLVVRVQPALESLEQTPWTQLITVWLDKEWIVILVLLDLETIEVVITKNQIIIKSKQCLWNWPSLMQLTRVQSFSSWCDTMRSIFLPSARDRDIGTQFNIWCVLQTFFIHSNTELPIVTFDSPLQYLSWDATFLWLSHYAAVACPSNTNTEIDINTR